MGIENQRELFLILERGSYITTVVRNFKTELHNLIIRHDIIRSISFDWYYSSDRNIS
jgi:hypothetical protein